MSFPNIPDISPNIDITLDDAINLLLVSVALEEISLSDLIRAETKKLESFLKQSNNKENSTENVLNLNRSIDDTLKNIIKLQMLLQFKLDNVRELIPTTTTTNSTTTTSTTTASTCSKTTTTKSTTTCSHTATCSTTTKATCKCGVMGKAKGWISNQSDRFCGRMAVAKLYAFNDDFTNRSIRYEIGDECEIYHMDASDGNIRMYCPCPQKMVLLGKGHIHTKAKGRPALFECTFTLTLWVRPNGTSAFRIEIISREEPAFNHNSGFITNKNKEDDSMMLF